MSLFIFRRDLRIKDNTALNECFKNSKKVYPIFIFTPEQIKNNNDYKSNKGVQFMIESLQELKINFLFGDYLDVIKDVVKKNNIDSIYFNLDYTPYSKKRDKDIKNFCESNKLTCNTYHDVCLYEPGSITVKSTGKAYKKFTPFYNNVINKKTEKPYSKSGSFSKVKSKYSIDKRILNSYYKKNPDNYFKGGRTAGLKKLAKAKTDFKSYSKDKDFFDYRTTELSPYLKFGCLSIREVYEDLKDKYGLKSDLIRQLIWRDFYYHIGNEYGFDVFRKSKIKWTGSTSDFNKWCDGETGIPIIDANMRMLNKTGYMYNRGRLLTASFLVKNLKIDWRKGEKYFATQLIDYDPIVNNGNWQWVAGTGADAQPYFRVFNPWTQGQKYDKEAEFIKKWIPELKDVESKHIHKWEKENKNYDVYIEPIYKW